MLGTVLQGKSEVVHSRWSSLHVQSRKRIVEECLGSCVEVAGEDDEGREGRVAHGGNRATSHVGVPYVVEPLGEVSHPHAIHYWGMEGPDVGGAPLSFHKLLTTGHR